MLKRQYIYDDLQSTSSLLLLTPSKWKNKKQSPITPIIQHHHNTKTSIKQYKQNKYNNIQKTYNYLPTYCIDKNIYIDQQQTYIKQAKTYCPLSKIRQQNEQIIKKNNLQKIITYSRSSEYKQYIQNITNRGDRQKQDIISQMRHLRNNNIYLNKNNIKEEEEEEDDQEKYIKYQNIKCTNKYRKYKQIDEQIDYVNNHNRYKMYQSKQMAFSIENLSNITQKQYQDNTIKDKQIPLFISRQAYLKQQSICNNIQQSSMDNHVQHETYAIQKQNNQKKNYVQYNIALKSTENKPKDNKPQLKMKPQNIIPSQIAHKIQPILIRSKSQLSIKTILKQKQKQNINKIDKQQNIPLYEQLNYYKKSKIKQNTNTNNKKHNKFNSTNIQNIYNNTIDKALQEIKLNNNNHHHHHKIKLIQEQSQKRYNYKYQTTYEINQIKNNNYTIDFKLNQPKINLITSYTSKNYKNGQNKQYIGRQQQKIIVNNIIYQNIERSSKNKSKSKSKSKSKNKHKISLVTISQKIKY